MDRSSDLATQVQWMADAGLEDVRLLLVKHLHFAVLAGWHGQRSGEDGYRG